MEGDRKMVQYGNLGNEDDTGTGGKRIGVWNVGWGKRLGREQAEKICGVFYHFKTLAVLS